MGAKDRRTAKPLKRSAGSRAERRTILVFTEGKNSEPDYVEALARLPHIVENVSLTLKIDSEHGVPLTLVQHAVDSKTDDEIDERWCIFDVEWPQTHPNLDRAMRMARKNGIELAISNPCFELWLMLHLVDCSKFLSTKDAVSKSQEIDGRAGKSVDGSMYMPKRKIAVRKARSLELRHEQNGTVFPNDNPSSGMYKFLLSIEPKEHARSIPGEK